MLAGIAWVWVKTLGWDEVGVGEPGELESERGSCWWKEETRSA